MGMIFNNSVNLVGKVVKDVDFSKTKKDKSVCKVVVVVERKINGSTIRSDYIPVSFWGKKADVAKDLIRKNDELMIVGSVSQERWEKNGEKRSRIVIQADKFWVVPPESEYMTDDDESDFEVDDMEDCNDDHDQDS